jgi:hypothetical protein
MSAKRKVIFALLAAMLASGFMATMGPSQAWADGVAVSSVLVVSLLIFAWYFEDARERAFRRGYWQDFGVAGAALVGLPVYLYRTRGAWRGTLAVGGALLFYLLMLLTMVVGSVLGLVVRLALGMPVPL